MLFIEVTFCIMASLTSGLFINKYNFCSVRTSTSVTLMYCLLAYLFFQNYESLFVIIFGGSFIGMSLFEKTPLIEVFFASLVFSLLIHPLENINPGVGGLLGFCAFASLLITKLVRKLINLIRLEKTF